MLFECPGEMGCMLVSREISHFRHTLSFRQQLPGMRHFYILQIAVYGSTKYLFEMAFKISVISAHLVGKVDQRTWAVNILRDNIPCQVHPVYILFL